MKWLDWISSLMNPEAEFPYLAKYIEVELERSVDPRRDIAVASSVGSFFVGAGLTVLSWFYLPVIVSVGIAFGTVLLAVAAWGRYVRSRSEEERTLSANRRAARHFLYELRKWRYVRMLRRKLSGGTGELLDAAARYWLRAHSCLSSDCWKQVHKDSTWRSVGDKATTAMDASMAKLLLVAQSNSDSTFLSPQFETARGMVEGMRELAKEVERLTDKLHLEAESAVGSPTDVLRETLAEIRNLETAQDEVDRINRLG